MKISELLCENIKHFYVKKNAENKNYVQKDGRRKERK